MNKFNECFLNENPFIFHAEGEGILSLFDWSFNYFICNMESTASIA